MADDRLQVAVDIVARRVLDHLVNDGMWLDDAWGDEYPEIGEHDWDAVRGRLRSLVPKPSPNEEFEAAYEYLTGRAETDA